jgi:hypothetical protein
MVTAPLLLASMLFTGVQTLPVQTMQRHISNGELRAEKHGRIVDADSGAGIPGVKVIVKWRTSSTGLPGLTGGGGTWCALQKIVETDTDGNYTIPDVSHELDISDRGTNTGMTPMGLLSVKHDSDWLLLTFKSGYLRVSDTDILKLARTEWLGGIAAWPSTPEVTVSSGRITILPIALRPFGQEDTATQWLYDAIILAGTKCSDRMANAIEAPERNDIVETMRTDVRPTPCALPAATVIDPASFGAFVGLSHPGRSDNKFYDKAKELSGLANTGRVDPLERVSTTADALCQAMTEEEKGK